MLARSSPRNGFPEAEAHFAVTLGMVALSLTLIWAAWHWGRGIDGRLGGLITGFVGSGARTGSLAAPTTTMRETLAGAKADLAAIEKELKTP